MIIGNNRKRAAKLKLRKKQLHTRKTKRLLFEGLEQRMLLAADFVFDANDAIREQFNLRLTSDGTNLQLIDTVDGSIVKAQSIVDNSGTVEITGSNQSDTLVFESSLPSLSIRFDGREGDDTLVGPSSDSDWRIHRRRHRHTQW